MNLVTILWCMVAAAALTLAVVHGLVWAMNRKNLSALIFSFLALAIAALAPLELGMMHSSTVEAYGQWGRWCHVPMFVAFVSTVLFLHVHLDTGRWKLAAAIILARLAVLIINFTVHPNFNWKEIISLQPVTFIGEKIYIVQEAVIRPWQWLGIASILLFLVDTVLELCRRREDVPRRKTVMITMAILGFIAASATQPQLIVWGLLKAPIAMSPPFLILMGAMAYELGRDVHLSRRAQQESERLREELAHATRISLAGHLASGLAHELQQPLGAILRNAEAAELLLQEPEPDLDELRDMLMDIRKDDQRAGRVINSLRTLLKRRQIDTRHVALGGLISEVLALVRPDAVIRRIVVDCDIAGELPPVAGDPVHLHQVLLNLVVNGMDALNGSVETRRVLIAVRRVNSLRIEVAVSDSGHGIADEYLDRVFDPFFTTKPQGFGIGLSVSRSIIEAHGGRIWAERNEQQGATFRIQLPVAQDIR